MPNPISTSLFFPFMNFEGTSHTAERSNTGTRESNIKAISNQKLPINLNSNGWVFKKNYFRRWSSDEKKLLQIAIATQEKIIDWNAVAAQVKTRSGQQCRTYYRQQHLKGWQMQKLVVVVEEEMERLNLLNDSPKVKS